MISHHLLQLFLVSVWNIGTVYGKQLLIPAKFSWLNHYRSEIISLSEAEEVALVAPSIMSKGSIPSFGSILHQLSLIEEFHGSMSFNTYPSSDCILLITNSSVQSSRDRSKLGFLDLENINGISNFDLPLILAITIVDYKLIGFLVDDWSSCNILYTHTLELICL